MVLSIRSIAIRAAVVFTFAIPSEGFISVPKNIVSRLDHHSIVPPTGIPFNYVVSHASTAVDEQIDEKELLGKLRSSMVTNINNELVSLGDIIGSDKSVVVFLRHLG
jgi:hypothetical protein